MKISAKMHPKVKYGLHYTALTLSIGSVWYTLFQISPNPIMKSFFSLFALFVEVAAQYVRGLAKSYGLIKKGWRQAGLWAIYLIYIIIFASLSAFVVFKSEINMNKQSHQTANTALSSKQTSLKQYQDDLAFQKLQREDEKKTGRGPKYADIESKISQDEAEIKRLESEIEEAGKHPEVYQESGLNSLTDNLRTLLFYAAIVVIYLILIITPWDIELETDKGTSTVSTSEVLPQISGVKTPVLVTEDKTFEPDIDTNPLTSSQMKAIDIINILYGDEELPDELTPLKRTGYPERTVDNITDYFKRIGAIKQIHGKPFKPVWTKSRLIKHIEKEYVA